MNIADQTNYTFYVDLLILHGLKGCPEMTGLEISKFVKTTCGGKFSCKLPTIYTELERLTNESKISEKEKNAANVTRKYYKIEDGGLSFYDDNKSALSNFIQSLDEPEQSESQSPTEIAETKTDEVISEEPENVIIEESPAQIVAEEEQPPAPEIVPEEVNQAVQDIQVIEEEASQDVNTYEEPSVLEDQSVSEELVVDEKFREELFAEPQTEIVAEETASSPLPEVIEPYNEPVLEFGSDDTAAISTSPEEESAEDNIQLTFFDKNVKQEESEKSVVSTNEFSVLDSILGLKSKEPEKPAEPEFDESDSDENIEGAEVVSDSSEAASKGKVSDISLSQPLDGAKEAIIHTGASSVSTRNKKNFISIAASLEAETFDKLVYKKYDPAVSLEYKQKYYVYKNKMNFINSAVLFGIMILEILVPFLIITLCQENPNTGANVTLLIIGALISGIAPYYFTIQYLRKPYEAKRYYYRNTMKLIPKFLIFAGIVLVTFIINLLVMGAEFKPEFLYTIIQPCLLASNIPLYYLINDLIYDQKYCEIKLQ